jgi:hypothetical protein
MGCSCFWVSRDPLGDFRQAFLVDAILSFVTCCDAVTAVERTRMESVPGWRQVEEFHGGNTFGA